jgi:hypothetical protein
MPAQGFNPGTLPQNDSGYRFHDMLKLRARAVSRIYHSERRKWLVASAPSRI